MVVDDPATNEVISWNADGTTFIVWQTAEFERDLLPTLFDAPRYPGSWIISMVNARVRRIKGSDHTNKVIGRIGTQVMKLPRKWVEEPTEGPVNQRKMKFKRIDPCGFRKVATSRWEFSNEMLSKGEKDQLCSGKKNGVLNFELEIAKKKCKQLLELVAVEEENYEHEGPMLFGVRLMEVQRGIEKKRKRVEVKSL
ncbi:heat stress transcription factor B-3-like [Primulina tabacum]|uniref:heat stress transcription factor B-3-like n=1 Tax=Primulina tabacum TaxID=48773 RepID=UPI003F59B431